MLKLQALLRPNFVRSVSTFPPKCSLARSGENEIELTKGILRATKNAFSKLTSLNYKMTCQELSVSECMYACIMLAYSIIRPWYY